MILASSSDLLDIWERTSGLAHPDRAVEYAALADPGRSTTELREMPIGRRDASIVHLRAATFGPRLGATAACPRCDEVVEFELDLAALLAGSVASDTATVDVELDGWRVSSRLPTTADLIDAAADSHGIRGVLERCIVAASNGGAAAQVDELPVELVDKLGDRLSAADPAADIRLALACGACGFAWEAPFDIVPVMDRELDAWARSTLQDVAVLARAFGWTERDVLALGPARRRSYLELVST